MPTALITGTTSGIGQASAYTLAKTGISFDSKWKTKRSSRRTSKRA